MSDRRLLAFGAIALASAFCVALLVARWVYSDAGVYAFLIWNLFLAWIPLVAAVVVYDARRRGVRGTRLAPIGVVWLLFLPNAPYLLTDVLHLGSRDGAPIWFDIILFTAFAWVGTLLGFVSIYLMQTVVRATAGVVWGWALVLGSIAASSFGIYLGRTLGWNSWDFVTRPRSLLADVWTRLTDPVEHPGSYGMTLALTALLSVLYLALYAFAQLPSVERTRR